ncbi:MAG: hypothetical protein V3T31_07510 [candidate division Zixibacteria bacterium]
MVMVMASIYVQVGEHDKAISELDVALSVPCEISVKKLAIDPLFAPLQNNPRFREVVSKYASNGGS